MLRTIVVKLLYQGISEAPIMESNESQDSSVEETDDIDDMEVTEEDNDTRYPIQILNIKTIL